MNCILNRSGRNLRNLYDLATPMLGVAAVFVASSSPAYAGPALPTAAMAQGKAFVTQELESLRPNWNSTKFSASIDPRINVALVARACKQYSDALGPIKTIGTPQVGQCSLNMGINVPDYVGSYTSNVDCAKGPAQVTLVAAHTNGRWLIQSFNVHSELLKMLGQDQAKDALAFADSFIKQWAARKFALETLYQNADAECTQELRKNEMATKLLCASMQKMGPVKSLSAPRMGQVSPLDNGVGYSVVSRSTFDRTHSDIVVQVTKVGAQWKVHSVHMSSFNN
jgi:hypothetical protein